MYMSLQKENIFISFTNNSKQKNTKIKNSISHKITKVVIVKFFNNRSVLFYLRRYSS